MKYKNKLLCGLLVATILISGCSAAQDKDFAQNIEIEEVADTDASAEGTDQSSVEDSSSKSDEETSDDSNAGNSGTSADSAGDGDHSTVADYDYDYTEDIKADVEAVVEASSSLQEELSNIPTITDKYEDLFSDAETQFEMNVAAGWYHEIWDAELNNIWKRFTDLADEETKQRPFWMKVLVARPPIWMLGENISPRSSRGRMPSPMLMLYSTRLRSLPML